jgi:hypothetical protein
MNQAFERIESIATGTIANVYIYGRIVCRTLPKRIGLIVLKYPMSNRRPNISLKYTEDESISNK